jgi:hypothetical protein
VFDIAVDGHPFNIDWEPDAFGVARMRRETIPLLRQQADQSVAPGEASLNPEGFWRRNMESWHHGAGQAHRDRLDSDPYRFHQSYGVDIWTKYELGPLFSTARKRTSSDNNVQVIAVNGVMHIVDGSDTYYTANPTAGTPTFTAMSIRAGEAANSIANNTSGQPICTDGATLYVIFTDGIHTATGSTSGTAAHYADDPAGKHYSCIGFAKGRLMAAADNKIYNVIAGGAAPAALFTHSNPNARWTAFADGNTMIYAAATGISSGEVYKIPIKSDASGLDTPSPAMPALPPGEYVLSMRGGLGFLALGTSRGVRICAADTAGNLFVGPLIPTQRPGSRPSDPYCPVYGLCYGSPSFLYATDNLLTSQYLGTNGAGLVKLDLAQEVNLLPPYASDLLVNQGGSGIPTTVEVIPSGSGAGILVFAVANQGFYVQGTSYVIAGALDTGFVTFALPDKKIPIQVDAEVRITSPATIALGVAIDGTGTTYSGGDTFPTVATYTSADMNPETSLLGAPVNAAQMRRMEWRITLGSDGTGLPTLRHLGWRAEPCADGGLRIWVPVLTYETIEVNGTEVTFDPEVLLAALDALRRERTPVPYQHGKVTETVILEDYEQRSHHETVDGYETNGTILLQLKKVA